MAVAITLDTDWAPDFAIDWCANALLERGVRATWFVTHHSAAIDRLRLHPERFELGIHPNFLSGSTHGATVAAVLRHCMELVPEAVSLRTHALVQSTPTLEAITTLTPVRTDVSVFLPGLCVAPFRLRLRRRDLLRVPYQWEDDFEMDMPDPCWDLALRRTGLAQVFDFHPIHVYLNSASFAPYTALKAVRTRLTEITEAEAAPFQHHGPGTQTAFLGLLDHAAGLPNRGTLIREFDG